VSSYEVLSVSNIIRKLGRVKSILQAGGQLSVKHVLQGGTEASIQVL